MKKYILWALPLLFLVSCDEGFLTKIPETTMTPASFFKSDSQLELWTNRYYNLLDGIGTTSVQYADDEICNSLGNIHKGTRSATTQTWSWSYLRYINQYFENMDKCESEATRTKYAAVAHFFRAWFYFQMVRQFGDVPYYDYVILSNDTESLNKPRDSRTYVMKKCMDDLDNAIANLPDAWPTFPVYHLSKNAALAVKSRLALYEGTYMKYHNIAAETVDGTSVSSTWFLQQAVDAASQVMATGKYSLYNKNTMNLDPTKDTPYREYFLLDNAETSETILAIRYSIAAAVYNSTQFIFTSNRVSASRRFVNHYLMKDGTPIQDVAGWETQDYYTMFQDRDPRMEQTLQGPDYIVRGGTEASIPNFNRMCNGIRVIKYIDVDGKDQGGTSTFDQPFIRYAEVLLNYAEAKAELGTLTDADWVKTMDVIRARAGVATLGNMPTTADALMKSYYPNATGSQLASILEIRRERTVELFAEGQRCYDLFRWKEGKWMTPSSTSGYQGIYISALGEYDMNHDGSPDAYFYTGAKPSGINPSIPVLNIISVSGNLSLSEGDHGYLNMFSAENYVWDEGKDYLYPIPLAQIQATNGALTQNPGYDDIDR